MASNLTDLLDLPDRDAIRQVLLDYLLRPELPVTDWHSGAVLRTQFELDAAVILDLVDAIAAMTSQSFLGTDEEKGADSDWLTMLAHGWYEVDRVEAQAAQQLVALSCAAGYGPYNITQGNIEYLATDGSAYIALTGGSLSSATPLVLEAIAESPGAARGLINALKTKLPGVTVTGASIKVSGTPLYGRDQERDTSLVKRCDDRWPTFDVDPSDDDDRVVAWAKEASTSVTRTRLDPDPVNPGGVILTVAGSNGPVTPVGVPLANGPIPVVQAYIDARLPITDYVTVQDSQGVTALAGGTVFVPAALMSQVQAAADKAWLAYLGAAKIGGSVAISELIYVVMSSGAFDFQNVLLAGSVDNMALASNQVGVPSENEKPLTKSLDWKAI